jgi:4-hydroxybenzoate polyprenyltransferase
LYSGFAFVISLIREAVKDIEDIDGDQRFGCYTMPIAWGINATKVFVAVWLIVLIGALVIVQFYVLNHGWWLSATYCILFIVVPLAFILKSLKAAGNSKDYHRLSSFIKGTMLTVCKLLFRPLFL